MKAKNYRATLWVNKVYDKGLEGYWTWELIVFAVPPPCHAVLNLVPQFRFGTQEEAVKNAEKYAKAFEIEIDQRAYPAKSKK